MSGDCIECGGKLLWGGMSWVEHTDGHHQVRRKILLRILARQLREEASFRRGAADAARWGHVLVWWRIVLPTDVGYYRCEIPGDVWDTVDRTWLLDTLGRSVRDGVETFRGIRPHPMRVKYRVFDERKERAPEWVTVEGYGSWDAVRPRTAWE